MKNPKVDFFFQKDGPWQQEYAYMRKIALNCGLKEELKWGKPCYTHQGNNVILIHGFKNYCAYLFHKGVLLKDEKGILVKQTKNVQAARQIRFTNIEDINEKIDLLKAYILEAVEIEKAGMKVELKKTKDFEVAEEFQTKLNENPELEQAFNSLTPGRQRGYLLHFAGAKKSETRTRRVENNIPNILNGKGLHD